MKKIFSSLVALALFMCCCGCGGHSESIEYKRVEYNNDQVLDKILVFMIMLPVAVIFKVTSSAAAMWNVAPLRGT